MIAIIKPNKILSSKSIVKKNYSEPFKFSINPNDNEWFAIGFQYNNFYGEQLLKLNFESSLDILLNLSWKRFANVLDINNPSKLHENTTNIYSKILGGYNSVEVKWQKEDMINEYIMIINVTNNNSTIVNFEIQSFEWIWQK